ncbi:MAG: hypothetical protein KF819_24045 [Labilithrix sp.]|nr:hypothetical protein [Labilithrix sp.]
MRWVGRTSAHARVIDFVTNAPEVRTYVRTGAGTAKAQIFDPQYTRGLAGRVNATLPLHIAPNDRDGYVDQGDLAMTEFPFYGNSAIDNPRAHWGIHGAGGRWEADDYFAEIDNGNTHHQVWVRPAPCNDMVKNLGESDVDCGGSCGGCAATKTCAKDGDCKSGSCVANKCAATLQTSCKTLLAARAGIASGVYTIDPDGAGAIAPFDAYCDMKFEGGGWTMVLSTANGSDPASSTEGVVLTGTTSHMPPATLTALAGLSTQTHVRTHATEVLRSVTSKAGTPAITRLGMLVMLEIGGGGPGDLADWTGPFADATHLEFTCPSFDIAWPSVYQSCGTNGLHLWTGQGGHSRWTWQSGNRGMNEPMELYVR